MSLYFGLPSEDPYAGLRMRQGEKGLGGGGPQFKPIEGCVRPVPDCLPGSVGESRITLADELERTACVCSTDRPYEKNAPCVPCQAADILRTGDPVEEFKRRLLTAAVVEPMVKRWLGELRYESMPPELLNRERAAWRGHIAALLQAAEESS